MEKPLRLSGLSVLVAIFLGVAWPAVAAGQDGRTWQSTSYNDGNDAGKTHALLRYGVPETDDVVFQAECVSGSRVDVVEVIIAAETNGNSPGDPVRVQFLGAGFEQEHDGSTFIPEGDEGYSGALFHLSKDDDFWQALSSLKSLSYSVANSPQTDLRLRGSSRAVDDFLQICRQFQAGKQAPQPLLPDQSPAQAAVADPRWQTCQTLGSNRSLKSDTPVTVTFRNRSDGYRSVMWIGFDGVPVGYANLNPGEEYTINTFLTHPFMFTDGPGNCIEMFMPQPGVGEFNISAPGRDFGPE